MVLRMVSSLRLAAIRTTFLDLFAANQRRQKAQMPRVHRVTVKVVMYRAGNSSPLCRAWRCGGICCGAVIFGPVSGCNLSQSRLHHPPVAGQVGHRWLWPMAQGSHRPPPTLSIGLSLCPRTPARRESGRGVLFRHRGWSLPRAGRARIGRRRCGWPPARARGPGRGAGRGRWHWPR